MELVFSSHNEGKLAELRALLNKYIPDKGITVRSASDIGVGDVPETGDTFEENALIKARAAAERGYIAIADDSGLCVDALDGAPGVMSARWSGGDYADNNRKLIDELDGIAEKDRGASFVSVVVCLFPDEREPIIVRGECRGIILNECRGEGGFGYDPLFYVPELGKTFSELSAEEKNSISHRGKAMREFCGRFSEMLMSCN